MFVKGYQDATNVLEEIRNEAPSLHLKQRFQLEFERLVVLDYVIRNTGTIIYTTLGFCTTHAVQYSSNHIVQYSAVQWSTVQYSIVQYSTTSVQYSTVQFSSNHIVQYSGVQWSIVEHSKYSTV